VFEPIGKIPRFETKATKAGVPQPQFPLATIFESRKAIVFGELIGNFRCST
jgi:hypothetical protein